MQFVLCCKTNNACFLFFSSLKGVVMDLYLFAFLSGTKEVSGF